MNNKGRLLIGLGVGCGTLFVMMLGCGTCATLLSRAGSQANSPSPASPGDGRASTGSLVEAQGSAAPAAPATPSPAGPREGQAAGSVVGTWIWSDFTQIETNRRERADRTIVTRQSDSSGEQYEFMANGKYQLTYRAVVSGTGTADFVETGSYRVEGDVLELRPAEYRGQYDFVGVAAEPKHVRNPRGRSYRYRFEGGQLALWGYCADFSVETFCKDINDQPRAEVLRYRPGGG